MNTEKRKWNIVFFLLYGALMLWLLFDRPGYMEGVPYWEQLETRVNLIPFHTVRLYARLLDNSSRPHLIRLAVMNLGGNILLFIPLGYFLPVTFRFLRKFWATVLAVLAIISLVEFIQLFTLVGSCDIDDLILNLIGSGMGYGIYRLTSKKE